MNLPYEINKASGIWQQAQSKYRLSEPWCPCHIRRNPFRARGKNCRISVFPLLQSPANFPINPSLN